MADDPIDPNHPNYAQILTEYHALKDKFPGIDLESGCMDDLDQDE